MTRGGAITAAARELESAGSDTPLLDAQVLLAHVLGCSRASVVAGRRDDLAAEDGQRFAALLERRRAGEPVAYLIGEREFWSLPLAVDPRVLVPRPETERLVELTLESLRGWAAAGGAAVGRVPVVVDVGTGTGAIALALAQERGAALRVVAIDVSADALIVASRNARALARGPERPPSPAPALLRGDLLACLAAASVDVVVSNPPYLDDDDMATAPRELRFEPRLALWGGPDGLDVVRRLVAQAAIVLRENGVLLCEIGAGQGAAARAIAVAHGFLATRIEPDLAGRDRVLLAMRAARAWSTTSELLRAAR